MLAHPDDNQSKKNLSLCLLSAIAIDLLYGGIYCFVCQDYIYDKDMEQIAKEEQRKAWKLQGWCFNSQAKFLLHASLFPPQPNLLKKIICFKITVQS